MIIDILWLSADHHKVGGPGGEHGAAAAAAGASVIMLTGEQVVYTSAHVSLSS